MKKIRYLPWILGKIRHLALNGNVQFTLKALSELALIEIGLDETDVCEILAELDISDFKGRKLSVITEEYLYVFAQMVGGMEIYMKVIVREYCLVISFHEDLKNEN